MMLGGDLITLVIFVIVFRQWIRAEQRSNRRTDASSLQADAEVAAAFLASRQRS
jgi:hypothetical protein